MRATLFAAFSTVLLLAACSNPRNSTTNSPPVSKRTIANPSELEGSWQLNYINDVGTGLDELYPSKKPEIVFDILALRASGNTGCNSFSAPLTVDGSKISFEQPFILTKMMCPGEGERTFVETLKKIDSWALTDTSTLNLITGDRPMLRLIKAR